MCAACLLCPARLCPLRRQQHVLGPLTVHSDCPLLLPAGGRLHHPAPLCPVGGLPGAAARGAPARLPAASLPAPWRRLLAVRGHAPEAWACSVLLACLQGQKYVVAERQPRTAPRGVVPLTPEEQAAERARRAAAAEARGAEADAAELPALFD